MEHTPMDDFFVRALIAGIAVAAVAGPVGAIMLWRRMAFFGAAVAHSAVLGVAAGLLTGTSPYWTAFATCLVLAFGMETMFRRHTLAGDTVTGVIGHGSLALALVLTAFLDNVRIDLLGYLFGDILAISAADVATTFALAGVVGLVMALVWRPLVAVTTEPAIASAEGAPSTAVSLTYALLLAIVIAIGLRLVGALLIVSLLIMPAAAARPLAANPIAMAAYATGLAAIAVVAGLYASLYMDWPAGPAIAVVSAGLFLASLLIRR